MIASLTMPQIVATAFFACTTVLWVFVWSRGTTDDFYNYLFSFLFGLTPLFAGAYALYMSRIWGGLSSIVGKATFFIGLGIFLWGFGETIWSYYNFFLGIPAPYPSLADIGFAPSIFFYGLGSYYLAQAMGAKILLRIPLMRYVAVLVGVLSALLAYYLVVEVARQGVLIPPGETPLKIFFDIVYPVGGCIAFILAVLISSFSFPYLGGRFKYSCAAVLFGLCTMAVADIIFSYSTTVGTYYNANPGDLLLSTGMYLLSFGVLGFTQFPRSD